MSYSWQYLKNELVRGNYLFGLLKPFLKSDDCFLDVDCGYSPLAKNILECNYQLTGFDIHPEPIEYLKKTFPKGTWLVESDNFAEFEGYSVLLLLGVTTSLYPIYSSTYLQSLNRLINSNRPRVILVESADAADQQLYINVCQHLKKLGYTKKVSKQYDAQLERASLRHCSIWLKVWDYDYWRAKFWLATDLNRVHEEFYKSAGIKLTSYKIVDNCPPPLTKNKDIILEELILSKHPFPQTMLITGFWDAKFAFNLLADGYIVHGVEPYQKAVETAKQAKATLSAELQNNIKFSLGYAEDLTGHPKYDITVNFCLEHVRQPQHVLNEALKHTAKAAYFTPPIGRGCDSPSHLYHFQEADLNEMIPEGWAATFSRVKFVEDSPYPNCYIIEVTKK